jgi:hypothetical protein
MWSRSVALRKDLAKMWVPETSRTHEMSFNVRELAAFSFLL